MTPWFEDHLTKNLTPQNMGPWPANRPWALLPWPHLRTLENSRWQSATKPLRAWQDVLQGTMENPKLHRNVQFQQKVHQNNCQRKYSPMAWWCFVAKSASVLMFSQWNTVSVCSTLGVCRRAQCSSQGGAWSWGSGTVLVKGLRFEPHNTRCPCQPQLFHSRVEQCFAELSESWASPGEILQRGLSTTAALTKAFISVNFTWKTPWRHQPGPRAFWPRHVLRWYLAKQNQ